MWNNCKKDKAMDAMSLSHSHIDVWCARLSAIVDPVLLEQYGEMLSPQEREREQRFSLQPARHRFRVARALVRTTLSRYAPVSPERWTFTTSAQGRPEIAECLQPAERLSFNVAHAGDVVVCAVASGRDVGVDIERVVDRSIEPGIADLICAETEKQSLAVLQGMPWQQQFLALWTLKEAYAKACGTGLALPLHECAFEVQAGLTTVVMANAPGDAPSRWQSGSWGSFETT